MKHDDKVSCISNIHQSKDTALSKHIQQYQNRCSIKTYQLYKKYTVVSKHIHYNQHVYKQKPQAKKNPQLISKSNRPNIYSCNQGLFESNTTPIYT